MGREDRTGVPTGLGCCMEPPGISVCYDPGFWQLLDSLVLCFCLSVSLAGPLQADRAGWEQEATGICPCGSLASWSLWGNSEPGEEPGNCPTKSSQKSEHVSLPSPSPGSPWSSSDLPSMGLGQPAQPCALSALHPLQAAGIWPGWFSALRPSVSVTPRPLWTHLGSSHGCGQNQFVCFH